MLGDVLRWKRSAGQESTMLPYAPPGRLTTKPQRHRHGDFYFSSCHVWKARYRQACVIWPKFLLKRVKTKSEISRLWIQCPSRSESLSPRELCIITVAHVPFGYLEKKLARVILADRRWGTKSLPCLTFGTFIETKDLCLYRVFVIRTERKREPSWI